MRAIKFRILWAHGFQYLDFDTEFTSEELDDIRQAQVYQRDWMQFTGLLDKNGTEIYEGDIVCVPNSEHYGKWAVKWYTNQYNLTPYDNPVHEVIGNIHENPELLS